jgi:lysophospholipase L1-like esterase
MEPLGAFGFGRVAREMMQQWARLGVLFSVLALVAAATASPAAVAKPGTVPGLPVQLSLGDSWAFGVGAAAPSEGGYVPRLNEALRQQYNCSPGAAKKAGKGCKHLQLVNLAVGGATTPTLIAGQLPEVVRILESRNSDKNPRNDVEVVTLHIGGNDVTFPILGACVSGLTTVCMQTIQTEFAALRSDLNVALSTLRNAAGPDTRIVIGTYDNPIATCQIGSIPGAVLLAAIVLEGGLGISQGLNDIIRDVAASHGVEVAEVFGDLGPQDWVGGSDCLHPDDSGYEKVTDAFLEVLVGA